MLQLHLRIFLADPAPLNKNRKTTSEFILQPSQPKIYLVSARSWFQTFEGEKHIISRFTEKVPSFPTTLKSQIPQAVNIVISPIEAHDIKIKLYLSAFHFVLQMVLEGLELVLDLAGGNENQYNTKYEIFRVVYTVSKSLFITCWRRENTNPWFRNRATQRIFQDCPIKHIVELITCMY